MKAPLALLQMVRPMCTYAHEVQKFNKHGKMVPLVGKKVGRERGLRVSDTTSTKSMCVTAPMAGSRPVFDSNLKFVRLFGIHGDPCGHRL